jgi:hypothetical protein
MHHGSLDGTKLCSNYITGSVNKHKPRGELWCALDLVGRLASPAPAHAHELTRWNCIIFNEIVSPVNESLLRCAVQVLPASIIAFSRMGLTWVRLVIIKYKTTHSHGKCVSCILKPEIMAKMVGDASSGGSKSSTPRKRRP